MSFRNGVSGRVAAALLARCRRHLAQGSAMSVSPPVWRSVPAFAKNWFNYRVLAEVERLALEQVKAHPVLAQFAPEMEQNRFAMTPSALLYIWSLLESRRPRRIIEFGSGLSTRLFGQYARRMKAEGVTVSLLSVDHDEHWLSQTREAIARDKTDEFVVFCHAPISRQHLLGDELEAYTVPSSTLEQCAGVEGFELSLIDGPQGTIGRAGGLPLVAPYLAAEAIVLLDDALRPGEFAISRRWREAYAQNCADMRLQLLDRHGLMQTWWRGRGPSQGRSGDISLPAASGDTRPGSTKLHTISGLT